MRGKSSSFTEPYFLERDVSAGFDLFRVEREYEESSYDEARTGGSLRSGYDLAPDLRQTVNYTLKSTEIRDVEDDASRFIKEQEGTTVVSQIGQTLTYDKRDNRIDPRDGYIAQFTTEVAGAADYEQYGGLWFYAEDYHQQYLAKNPGGYCGLGGTGVRCVGMT